MGKETRSEKMEALRKGYNFFQIIKKIGNEYLVTPLPPGLFGDQREYMFRFFFDNVRTGMFSLRSW